MISLRSLCLGLALAASILPTVGAARAEDPEPAVAEAKIPWVRDWNAAKAEAKRDGKDLLIDFTGSDWCGWCKRLDAEVFGQAAFLEKATKQFVMVFLDFPRNAELKRAVVDPKLNEQLNQEFGVEGFPTIVLATAEGMPYARTGYREGGPEGYLTHLGELRASGEKVKGLLAKGKTDIDAFKSGFEVLADAGFLGCPSYSWTIEHAEAKDADGSLGLKAHVEKERARQKAAVEEKALQALLQGVQRREDVPWEKLHEFLKASKYLSGMPLLQMSLGTADWLVEQGRHEEAKALYQLPLRDPDIAANPKIKALVEEKLAACVPAPEKPAEPAPESAPVEPK